MASLRQIGNKLRNSLPGDNYVDLSDINVLELQHIEQIIYRSIAETDDVTACTTEIYILKAISVQKKIYKKRCPTLLELARKSGRLAKEEVAYNYKPLLQNLYRRRENICVVPLNAYRQVEPLITETKVLSENKILLKNSPKSGRKPKLTSRMKYMVKSKKGHNQKESSLATLIKSETTNFTFFM